MIPGFTDDGEGYTHTMEQPAGPDINSFTIEIVDSMLERPPVPPMVLDDYRDRPGLGCRVTFSCERMEDGVMEGATIDKIEMLVGEGEE